MERRRRMDVGEKDVQQMCILKFSFQNTSIDGIRTIKPFMF